MAAFLTGLDDADRDQVEDAKRGAAPRPGRPRATHAQALEGPGARSAPLPDASGAHAAWLAGSWAKARLLAPEQALVLENDPGKARVTARAYVERYLRLPNYSSNLERLGFGEEDLAGQGSDRLVDAIVGHGTAEQVAAQVRAHLEAGADHVCVQPLAHGGGIDAGALEVLAPFLLAL